jgi:SAM-dependent methyltransferase
MKQPNAQYNLAAPESVSIKLAARVRGKMFQAFMREFAPGQQETILDIGATSDQNYSSSNYFEALYPYKDNITAAGLDEGAGVLVSIYPGLCYVRANALALPFTDGAFDLVHSSAVLEHVGDIGNQTKMIAECLRVCRRGICLTTPNRWFPIEVHTKIPFLHWLPKRWGRAIFRRIGYDFFAREENLNLMTAKELHRIMIGYPEYHYRIASMRVAGWVSNLVLLAHKKSGRSLLGYPAERLRPIRSSPAPNNATPPQYCKLTVSCRKNIEPNGTKTKARAIKG